MEGSGAGGWRGAARPPRRTSRRPAPPCGVVREWRWPDGLRGCLPSGGRPTYLCRLAYTAAASEHGGSRESADASQSQQPHVVFLRKKLAWAPALRRSPNGTSHLSLGGTFGARALGLRRELCSHAAQGPSAGRQPCWAPSLPVLSPCLCSAFKATRLGCLVKLRVLWYIGRGMYMSWPFGPECALSASLLYTSDAADE